VAGHNEGVRGALAIIAACLIVGAGCGPRETATPGGDAVNDPGFIVFTGYQPTRRASGFEYWAMRPDGTELRQLTIQPYDLSFAPGGRFIAMMEWRWDENEDPEDLVVVSRPDGSERRRVPLPQPGGGAGWPSVSPDGKRVALSFSDDPMFAGSRDLWAGPVDGEGYKQLSSMGEVSSTAWSPDGEHIAFTNGYAEVGVYVVRADGTELRRVAEGSDPAWSPDGKRIAFAGPEGGILIVSLDEGKPKVVSRTGFLPAWSPDGKWLAFFEGKPCGEVTCNRVFLVDVTGGHARRVGPQLYESGYLAWTSALMAGAKVTTSLNLHKVDWANVSLPGSVCGAEHRIQLRNGNAIVNSNRWPDVPRVTVNAGWNSVVYGDVDGDGADDAALVVDCNNGGGTASGVLAYAQVIFTGGDHSPRVLGLVTPQSPTTYGAPLLQIEINRGEVVAHESWYGCCDGTCCPSGRATTTWKLAKGTLLLGKTVVEKKPKS
jgi:dipeptidyl aminopeptidase/acylaminoacyl peptidase